MMRYDSRRVVCGRASGRHGAPVEIAADRSHKLPDARRFLPYRIRRSFWMWDPLKEKWDFVRDSEEHKVEAMKKFEECAFGRGGGLGQQEKRHLPLSRWLQ